jgi:hypothetical protein
VVYRKGELSKAMIDREWPHQVVLPAYCCGGSNYVTMRLFCEAERLSLCVRGHSSRRNDTDFVVFCLRRAAGCRTIPNTFGRRVHRSEGPAEGLGSGRKL